MFIQVREQWNSGWRSAKARDKGDESTANFHYQWSQKAMKLSDDKKAEQEAFDRGYRMYHDGYWFTDNPYP